MPRDTSNPTTKARSSKHAAATGLKTGNIRTKGENFYRDAKQARRVNMLSGKSGRAIRNADGKIIQEAEFQSKEITPGRVQPDRRWFGNTRTISQSALEHFREGMKEKTADPYAVVLKRNKLPLSLLTDAVSGKSTPDLTTTEPFSDTFGTKAQRKRPRLDVGSIEELAGAVASHAQSVQDAQVQAEKDQAISDLRDTEGTVDPESLKRQEEESQLGNVQQDWILGAGTSKRIWGELYKVIDSSDVLLHVLDARDPIGTRCDSVEAYLAKEKRGKKVIYVLNKVDLVPGWVAARWCKILSKTHPTIAFHASINNSFGKGSLIQLLRQFSSLFSDKKQISVGFIGYPNVGKSSIINTLKKKAVCKTAPIPGETKVWQYITLMRRIYLIDCPGIVPPSARDTESQKVLKGIVRVEHLSDPASHIQFLLDRVRKEYLARTYGVPEWENAEDFLTKLARKTGKLQRGGEADYRTVATFVINDWIRGKIPYFVPPPEPVDAAGKPLPRPLKLGSGVASTTPVASTSASKLDTDAEGNTIRKLPGVTQPLHQIVHSTKFLPDDNKKIEDDEDEDDEPVDSSFYVEDDDEEWGGIASEGADGLEDDDEEEEGDESAEPLEWDDLFANAEGALDKAEESFVTVDDDEEELSGDEEEEEVEIIVDQPKSAAAAVTKASKKKAAGKKRNRAIDEVSSEDEDEEAKPAKEARMTTNKKKATNFFTTANVKNKSRRGGPVKDQAARHAIGQGQKGKGTGKGRRGQRSTL
ncbi:putative GTPase NOG2 [Sporobolomyces salmoneus]|uniref:putative GTPase NOG2 n=1 Tax=Sporobolomyces salmoneus TaxID=183962 RepID=UPI00317620C7